MQPAPIGLIYHLSGQNDRVLFGILAHGRSAPSQLQPRALDVRMVRRQRATSEIEYLSHQRAGFVRVTQPQQCAGQVQARELKVGVRVGELSSVRVQYLLLENAGARKITQILE